MKNIAVFYLIFFYNSTFSQNENKFGYADTSIHELAQFEYYCGIWKTKMEMKQQDDTFKMLNNTASVKGWFLDDHKTFQSEFTLPDGHFSTDIRAYDTTNKEWKVLFLNAKLQWWQPFSCKIIDGKMTTIIKSGYSGRDKFDVKTVDTIVSQKQYQRDVYHSYDQMKTWIHVYKMYATKVS